MGESPTSADPAARPRRGRLAAIALVALAPLIALPGCGDDGEAQNADEPAGEFPIEIETARFAAKQDLAETNDLTLAVVNAGSETIPDLAVTIWIGNRKARGPFYIRSRQPGLADPNRPAWVLEQGYPKLAEPGMTARELDHAPPAGAEAAQTDTFAFGPLEPGERREMVWRVTPVRAGEYTVNYEIAAGLGGKAKAVTPSGDPVEGSFEVRISDRPPRTRVNAAGEVVEQ